LHVRYYKLKEKKRKEKQYSKLKEKKKKKKRNNDLAVLPSHDIRRAGELGACLSGWRSGGQRYWRGWYR